MGACDLVTLTTASTFLAPFLSLLDAVTGLAGSGLVSPKSKAIGTASLGCGVDDLLLDPRAPLAISAGVSFGGVFPDFAAGLAGAAVVAGRALVDETSRIDCGAGDVAGLADGSAV